MAVQKIATGVGLAGVVGLFVALGVPALLPPPSVPALEIVTPTDAGPAPGLPQGSDPGRAGVRQAAPADRAPPPPSVSSTAVSDRDDDAAAGGDDDDHRDRDGDDDDDAAAGDDDDDERADDDRDAEADDD